jgi:hypothetical protein
MTHINQRNQLDVQITNYVRFLKIANRSQSIKLSKEISKLSSRIATIDEMSYLSQRQELAFSFETKQSKLNFKTIETPTDMRNQKRLPQERQHPIFEEAKDSRNRALQLASEHKDIKPIRYLLKN